MAAIGKETRIVGVHPVDEQDDVYLVEVEIIDPSSFDWSSVTQEDDKQPESNWQTAWDEQALPASMGPNRFVFFFHYLRLDRPLLIQGAPADLPTPTPMPDHLAGIGYEAP